ncbi:MAG TPA: hypothetical protein VKH15_18510 [Candidatus Acidoferrum sp.]|nr:hypothetical protein [Candidatus Acidoferrum sp.]
MQTLIVEAFGPLAGALILLVAILGVRHFVHQLRSRQSPEQLQAARDSFRNRLVHPKAAEVEQGIGALLPQRLLALYDDHQTVLGEQIEIRIPLAELNDAGNPKDSDADKDAVEWIEAFLPLDLESQKFTVDLLALGLGKGFCFATDGSGNFYWTPAGETRQPDAPVFFVCQDPQGNVQVTSSLNAFLSWPRRAATADLS